MQKVLISGASVAGPVLAYWLRQYGFRPTVVERTSAGRHGLGGHAVDLFAAAVEITARMGLADRIHEARTRTRWLSMERYGKPPVDVDLDKLSAGLSDQHVEILRGELTSILYDATRAGVDYRFGDSIASLHDDGDGVDVTFEQAPPERFDLVIGADGMHSTVRRLVFGPEQQFRRPLGGYLGVYSLPNSFGLDNRMLTHLSVDRLVGVYGVHQTGQARATFLFRTKEELGDDHRDKERQKQLLRDQFRGHGWKVPQLLEHLDAADDFYFDSITQITLEDWHRGRVALVGDAGFCPGPAVGGGTSLAVVSAYVLAGELAAARSDLLSGLRNYQRQVRDVVQQSRRIGPKLMRSIIPASPTAVRLTPAATAVLIRLPERVQRFVWARSGFGKVLSSVQLPDYRDLVRTP
ncbi:monooxygenase FAD-binding protein [Kribbella flavida DSM 17836]|uniref:Monooxygenase FAD-binding protein n=1 Tax=Kribbella flavida (strain DSM 17836 / JCM 10339 / NBRC 14399) TaxID=479435 RepID=D2PW94_KRIFD|nr:FAD-dependent monooxygenase [Kribbella flavida]ADB31546.1 monooxygenase FAD-binding protein [Kribbella flavida DSM 17836]